MKKLLCALLAVPCLLSGSVLYNDPGGLGDFTGGVGSLDISSVVVDSDGTTLWFTIYLGGDPVAQNWYNYYVGIAKDGLLGGGNLNGPGGWGKNIQMSVGGMDYFIGAYPYWSGGFNLLSWTGSSWSSVYYNTATTTSSSVTIPVPLAALGMGIGSGFTFDVWTSTSGSDTVLDALSDSTSRWWNSDPFDTGANGLYFLVPEPGALSIAGVALALVAAAQLRRRGL
ncbi:MAG: hypothetical protein NZ739_05010 [Verrucomicrobiae bacterium]|nr:hypothetical protein [Verrucomicrobiae bacterium]MDW7980927.1 hypothetical protein [Verrucomicrobiales bacterium]